ncbi:sugar phosphate isomerase/epimerase family protein [Arcticibacterium luteifluviistationis]|nr:sugar phosphate isomerase/epimerase [Arcticibacterium luteifluviistationis]
MTNKLGMNLLLWGVDMTDAMFPILELIKETGYDTVEIPIMDLNPKKWEGWRKKLDELGLSVVAETINGPEHNSIDKSEFKRKDALDFNKAVLDCADVLGVELLIGPIHSALGVFTGAPATEEEKKWGAEVLHDLSEHAQKYNITLGLEYLNRFESYLVSCTDELMELMGRVNHPSCKLMFDTFHANIEEKRLPDAIRKMADHLVHVQLSENDRGTLGHGHVNFEEVISTLKEIDYKGVISVEAFSQKLVAANIWRKMFESEEQLTKDSYKYLKVLTR